LSGCATSSRRRDSDRAEAARDSSAGRWRIVEATRHRRNEIPVKPTIVIELGVIPRCSEKFRVVEADSHI
jgi:hypothetical protein